MRKKKDYWLSFAGKFCAKEAVLKALDEKVSLKDIEVINKNNKPRIFIKGIYRKEIFCSISHTKDYAAAFVIIS